MFINLQKLERFFVAGIIVLFSVIGSINNSSVIFGGLGKDGSFYPAIIFFFLFIFCVIFKREAVLMPNESGISFLIVFVFIAFISLLLNIDSWLLDEYQGVSGCNRAIVQYGSLCFYCTFVVALYNFFYRQKDSLSFVMKWIVISAVIAAIYSVFEVGALFSNSTCLMVRGVFDSFFRGDFVGDGRIFTYTRGVRSLTGEAAFFSLYSAVVLPWIFAGMFIYHGKKKICICMLMIIYIIFNILTTSRSAYVIFVVEMIVSIFMMKKNISSRKVFHAAGVILLIGSIGAFGFSSNAVWSNIDVVATFRSIFEYDDTHALSNMARYGSQQAALNMFMANPLVGVGFGEFGLHAANFYPDGSWYSPEITLWGSDIIAGPWPPTHNLYARLLAETGILGVVSWCGFLICLLRGLNHVRNVMAAEVEGKIIGALIVSITGIMVFGLLCDSVRMVPLWLLVGLSWSCLSKYKEYVVK